MSRSEERLETEDLLMNSGQQCCLPATHAVQVFQLAHALVKNSQGLYVVEIILGQPHDIEQQCETAIPASHPLTLSQNTVDQVACSDEIRTTGIGIQVIKRDRPVRVRLNCGISRGDKWSLSRSDQAISQQPQ